jgi:hypothetical protein
MIPRKFKNVGELIDWAQTNGGHVHTFMGDWFVVLSDGLKVQFNTALAGTLVKVNSRAGTSVQDLVTV